MLCSCITTFSKRDWNLIYLVVVCVLRSAFDECRTYRPVQSMRLSILVNKFLTIRYPKLCKQLDKCITARLFISWNNSNKIITGFWALGFGHWTLPPPPPSPPSSSAIWNLALLMCSNCKFSKFGCFWLMTHWLHAMHATEMEPDGGERTEKSNIISIYLFLIIGTESVAAVLVASYSNVCASIIYLRYFWRERWWGCDQRHVCIVN